MTAAENFIDAGRARLGHCETQGLGFAERGSSPCLRDELFGATHRFDAVELQAFLDQLPDRLAAGRSSFAQGARALNTDALAPGAAPAGA